MNVSEFSDDDNATSFHDQSSCHFGRLSVAMITTYDIISYASIAVGIPGNILAAIVWLRRRKTSSAVYLAALAITDLVYLLANCILRFIIFRHFLYIYSSWLLWGTFQLVFFLQDFSSILEALLVLSFSVERLIAILRPLKVCRQRALRRELLRIQMILLICCILF